VARAFGPADRITKQGLGDVEIGMSVSAVEDVLGVTLDDLSNAAGDGSCATASLGGKVYGLFTRSVLARIYISTSRYRTRKGVHVGDPARAVFRAYGRRVRSVPHAYVSGGRYLKVTMGHRRIVFETSRSGRITSISTGRKPEVDYIEGCA
jgi:hypothetical protein